VTSLMCHVTSMRSAISRQYIVDLLARRVAVFLCKYLNLKMIRWCL